MIGRWLRRPDVWTFWILLFSYAWFWHGRDWNAASRLMLTYALVDRGTIVLNGLEDQTHDIALDRGRYYTDKLPGYSLLGVVPYALARAALGLEPHPLGRKGFAYWPADYWVTLGVSGLLTALTGALLARMAGRLGCGPRASALVGLAYGLATPAYVYATLSYGHQASAFALLTPFALLLHVKPGQRTASMMLAGFLAAYAAVIELQVGPVSAILGLILIVQVARGIRPRSSIAAFSVGAAAPTLILLGYNAIAFGSPFDMGYFHHATQQFAQVHNADNPLGLTRPDWSKAPELLWRARRGIFRTGPILALAAPGWWVLARRRNWGLLLGTSLACLAVFYVNLSYPEWSGGWSTGPRLLTPLLPFAMLPVAALLAGRGRAWTAAAAALALAGGVIMLLYQGVGARIPDGIESPLDDAVWPLWTGGPVPGWATNGRFERTLLDLLWPGWHGSTPSAQRWVAFVPLVLFQIVGIGAMLLVVRSPAAQAAEPRAEAASDSIS